VETEKMLRQLPLRLSAGAYIVNSGLSKRRPDDSTAAALHGMAAGSYPFLKGLKANQFVRILSTAEIGLGAALMLPVVPAALAGAGLLAFSAGLVGLYLRTRAPCGADDLSGGERPSTAGLSQQGSEAEGS
jgi:hypothetical protein